ncbi:MAG: hypothetical protein PVS3B1_04390 [Ktedonobacteraceae bacterium]
MDVLTRKRIPEFLCHKSADVRTYIRPANLHQEDCNSKSLSYTAFAALNEPISEGEQKKDGKRPGPAAPQKPVPEKPKPQRQGDKGKRKGKSPRTEEAGSYIV